MPPWAKRAEEQRERLRLASDKPYLVIDEGDGEVETLSARDDIHQEVVEEFRELERTEGSSAALRYLAMVGDAGLSLADARDRWLTEVERAGKIKRQTIEGHRAAIRLLADFLRLQDPSRFPVSEAVMPSDVTRRLAGDYVAWRRATVSAKTGRHVSDATIHREVSSFMGLWRWVRRRGFGEGNPWDDQMAGSNRGHRPTSDDENDRSKRPYTTEELLKLIRARGEDWAPRGGGYAPALWDAVRLALLTGCRANELAGLRVGDLVDDGMSLRVGSGKTKNAVRVVPLCDYAQKVMARRLASLEDRSPGAPLWPDLPALGPDPRRGKTLSHRFGQARGRIIGDDVIGVDFHSFRRSFAAALRDAMQSGQSGIDPTLMGALMGHAERSLALKVYAPGALEQNLRRAVSIMWEHGLVPEVRAALLGTQDQRPPVVRLAPAARPVKRMRRAA